MGVVVAPIVEGQLEVWKEWCTELMGPRAEEMKDFNRRYGLTQGPGAGDLMPKIAASDNEFDRGFTSNILKVHGMDASQPPPGPMPELYFDTGS